MNLGDFASVATIAALVVSLVSLAISGHHYIDMRKREQKHEMFTIYHGLIRNISRGTDAAGPLKLASQLAYIYELRNFPEYADLTKSILMLLRTEWKQNDPDNPNNRRLSAAIDETLAYLEARERFPNGW